MPKYSLELGAGRTGKERIAKGGIAEQMTRMVIKVVKKKMLEGQQGRVQVRRTVMLEEQQEQAQAGILEEIIKK